MAGTHFWSCRGVLVAVALTAPIPLYAQTRDNPPAGLSSSKRMTQDAQGRESWTYTQPAAVFVKYRSVIVDPTTVYEGPDAQFEGIDRADRSRFALIVTDELRSEISKSFAAPAGAQSDTL